MLNVAEKYLRIFRVMTNSSPLDQSNKLQRHAEIDREPLQPSSGGLMHRVVILFSSIRGHRTCTSTIPTAIFQNVLIFILIAAMEGKIYFNVVVSYW